MNIAHHPIPIKKRPSPPASIPAFGTTFSPHMFTQIWQEGTGWHQASIEAYHSFQLDPASLVFHYGQAFFEGMKAYKQASGSIRLFRPLDNCARFNASAERLGMPTVDPQDHLQAIKELVKTDEAWIPTQVGTALYIRPTMIATEPYLGIRSSKTYIHFVITGPVGGYYATGFEPVAVQVSETYRRGVKGGTANIKAGGNYAGSLKAGAEAYQAGYDQVLWLDAITGTHIEEVGSSNIFFVYGSNTIVTPALSGSILPGVTRSSVLQLAQHLGLKAKEATLNIDAVLADITSGAITEVFSSGTAAVLCPIGRIGYKGTDYHIHSNQTGPVTQRLFDELTGIQYGTKQDIFNWVEIVE